MSNLNRVLLLDESRGIYIPKKFYENFDLKSWGLDPSQYSELLDVDHEHYWEAWADLLQDATHTDDKGQVWYLEQDGDLFAVCKNMGDE